MEDPHSVEKKCLILREIPRLITETSNINALADLLLDRAIDFTNAEKGSLMLANEKGELYILAAKGFNLHFVETYRTKIGEGIAGIVAQNKLPVLVEDIDKDERFKDKKRDHYKTKAFISCPLVSREKVIGVININDKKDGTAFTGDELDLLIAVADQAAIAVENMLLLEQLRKKAVELENINRKLLESDMNKTEFLTRVSHELRSPLNSIKGAVYYLLQTAKPNKGKRKEFYQIISKETEQLISLVENLLDFLRLEDETAVTKVSLVHLPEILREVTESGGLTKLLLMKNIKIGIDIKEGTYEIAGDKTKLVHLFMNLLEGLSYYLHGNDTIRIKAVENGFITVELIFSRKMPETVFSILYSSRYIYRTDLSNEMMRLYLAKKAAEAHRWGFEIENAEDHFLVSLTIPKSSKDKMDAILGLTMDIFAEFVSELLQLNICSIMLSDEVTAELTIRGVKGLSEEVVRRTRIQLGDQIAGWVALEGKPLLIEDIESDDRFRKKNIPQYNTKSLLSVPIKLRDRVMGVLNLNNKMTGEPFTKRDLYVSTAISERIANLLAKLYSGQYKENEVNQIINSCDLLLQAVKRYRKKRSLFPDLAWKIMEKIGAEEEEKANALYASTLHDLGLTLIDEKILQKKSLHKSEMEALKNHPNATIELLNFFEFSEDVRRAIQSHHERYDGTGYPMGLKGKEIPLIARVLSVVDSYCAMISERPYRRALTWKEALADIKAHSGSLYDPEIVKAFEEILTEIMS
ncbi:MAG: GAF domain-containing protein [Nitrospirota bacterium]